MSQAKASLKTEQSKLSWHELQQLTRGFEHWLCSFANAAHTPEYPYGRFRELLAVGARRVINLSRPNIQALHRLQETLAGNWWFGVIAYDVKNAFERLHSRNADFLGFPDLYLFSPEWVFEHCNDEVVCLSGSLEDFLAKARKLPSARQATAAYVGAIHATTSQERYEKTVEAIRYDIRNGEIYEMNYCIEFQAEACLPDPFALFQALNQRSPMPFAAFARLGQYYVLSASPERYMKRQGNRLVSQPIKGTAPRGQTPQEDEKIKQALFYSEKERAENMMIVDLVRNDLARVGIAGTVEVEELFGIYTFRRLHQMVSTISVQLPAQATFIDCLAATFPMGSMTGAPKVRAMELIEHYETQKRGWYSGTLGYITPQGDFDWNVLIRTIFYNDHSRRLSFQVGSAITYDASPAQEWAECLLKAEAMREILTGI
jgi:para-aminobenzoate synthetase component 1